MCGEYHRLNRVQELALIGSPWRLLSSRVLAPRRNTSRKRRIDSRTYMLGLVYAF
jgi:hypothetical protein